VFHHARGGPVLQRDGVHPRRAPGDVVVGRGALVGFVVIVLEINAQANAVAILSERGAAASRVYVVVGSGIVEEVDEGLLQPAGGRVVDRVGAAWHVAPEHRLRHRLAGGRVGRCVVPGRRPVNLHHHLDIPRVVVIERLVVDERAGLVVELGLGPLHLRPERAGQFEGEFPVAHWRGWWVSSELPTLGDRVAVVESRLAQAHDAAGQLAGRVGEILRLLLPEVHEPQRISRAGREEVLPRGAESLAEELHSGEHGHLEVLPRVGGRVVGSRQRHLGRPNRR